MKNESGVYKYLYFKILTDLIEKKKKAFAENKYSTESEILQELADYMILEVAQKEMDDICGKLLEDVRNEINAELTAISPSNLQDALNRIGKKFPISNG